MPRRGRYRLLFIAHAVLFLLVVWLYLLSTMHARSQVQRGSDTRNDSTLIVLFRDRGEIILITALTLMAISAALLWLVERSTHNQTRCPARDDESPGTTTDAGEQTSNQGS